MPSKVDYVRWAEQNRLRVEWGKFKELYNRKETN